MKACLICPIPELQNFVDEQATHHLLLAQLMDDPAYVDFYGWRSAERGDYLILDNGAKERGSGFALSKLLADAWQVGAQEIVLTDVRYRCNETIDASRSQLNWLRTEEGKEAYWKASWPRFMVVPQGATPKEWHLCLVRLLEDLEIAREDVPSIPPPVVGLAYHYDHLFEGGLLELMEDAAIPDTLEVHMLGWPRKLSTLRDMATAYPWIRSVDSGRPFSYGRSGLAVMARQIHVERLDNFFTSAIPERRHKLVRHNIETFRTFAGEGVEVQ